MVHALRECRRVLAAGGQLVDMRPTSDDRVIEVIAAGEAARAGLVDVSKGRPDDAAANAAIEAAVVAGHFERESGLTFRFTNYWDDLAGMREYVEGRWADFGTVSDETWTRAADLIAAANDRLLRFAIHGPIQIVCYRRS